MESDEEDEIENEEESFIIMLITIFIILCAICFYSWVDCDKKR